MKLLKLIPLLLLFLTFSTNVYAEENCDEINKLTWSGISLLNTDILSKIDNNNFPFDSWSSIVLPQIKEEKVTGEIYSDIWLDVGTKDRLELANKIIREEN